MTLLFFFACFYGKSWPFSVDHDPVLPLVLTPMAATYFHPPVKLIVREWVFGCVLKTEMMSNASIWKPDCSSNWKRHRIVPVFSFYSNLWNSLRIWYLPLRHREPPHKRLVSAQRSQGRLMESFMHISVPSSFLKKVVVIMSHGHFPGSPLGKCVSYPTLSDSHHTFLPKREKKSFWKKQK